MISHAVFGDIIKTSAIDANSKGLGLKTRSTEAISSRIVTEYMVADKS